MIIKSRVAVLVLYDSVSIEKWKSVSLDLCSWPFRLTSYGPKPSDHLVCEAEGLEDPRMIQLKILRFREVMKLAGLEHAEIRAELVSSGVSRNRVIEYRVSTLLDHIDHQVVVSILNRYKVTAQSRTHLTEERPYACDLIVNSEGLTFKQIRTRLNLAHAELNQGRPIPKGAIQEIRSFSGGVTD
ncbi:MAG: hypothetical protein AAB638_00975 [Patescibacteria group bacterium]